MHVLLGLVIEAATQDSYEHQVRKRFLEPLELDSMWFSGTAEPSDPTQVHCYSEAPFVHTSDIDPSFGWAAGWPDQDGYGLGASCSTSTSLDGTPSATALYQIGHPMLDHPAVTADVASAQTHFHAAVIDEIRKALAENDVVVVGMSVNPHVGRARKALDQAEVPYAYLGYGGYTSMWKERLAIKMWTCWPTFPQVFVKGRLIGGADATVAMLTDGTFANLIEAARPDQG